MIKQYDIELENDSLHRVTSIDMGEERTDGYTRYKIVTITVDGDVTIKMGDRICLINRSSGRKLLCMSTYSVRLASCDTSQRIITGLYFLQNRIHDWQNQINEQEVIRNAGSSLDNGFDSTLTWPR